MRCRGTQNFENRMREEERKWRMKGSVKAKETGERERERKYKERGYKFRQTSKRLEKMIKNYEEKRRDAFN